MAEILLNLASDVNLQIKEAEQTGNQKNPKKAMPSHLVLKLLKTENKEKILTEEKKI